MPTSHFEPDDFERDDLVFVSDLSDDDVLAWSDYDAEVAYTEPLTIALENGELSCPTCSDDSNALRDEYMVEEPVFREFDSPREFTLHAVLFSCTKGHRFIIELEEPLYEENPASATH